MVVDADFPGGNVAAPRLVSSRYLQFAAAAHDSPRPLWFYFRVDGAPGPFLGCELLNAEACFGPPLGWRNARPVYSADGVQWHRADAGAYLPHLGRFRFQVPVTGRSTWIAYCYPYTLQDLHQLLARLPAESVTELCRSEGGRSVPYVRLGNHEAPRVAVWILARQHAGETPASWVGEGLLEWLAGAGALEAGDVAFHMVPLVDVDGVEEGRFGKDQPPVDFNRDWGETPIRPAVAAICERLRCRAPSVPVKLVLDLHAPHQGDPACYFFGGLPRSMGDPNYQTQQHFLELLSGIAPARVSFRPTDCQRNSPPPGSAREYLESELQAPVLTLEMSYHLAQSGYALTPEDYRDFGNALARVVARLCVERTSG